MTGSTAAFLFDPAGPFSSSPSDVGKSVKFQFFVPVVDSVPTHLLTPIFPLM